MTSSLQDRVTVWLWGRASLAERRLVRKLDFFILTYACFSYFFNYLDRAAFANAYVAGLKEALHLHGRQYNVLLSMTSAGMLIGQFPSSIIIQKFPPRIWLSSMVVLWAGLTMASAGCKTYSQLCAVRFLMGIAESSTYAGCIYVIGSWYKTDEIAKRIAMLTVAGQVGNMFAGVMMAAIHTSMEGLSGLSGWQWVFIIDGVITLPIAVFGFFLFPDIPESTTAFYLSAEERRLALARIPPKKKDGHNVVPWSLVKRVFGAPLFYVACFFSFTAAAMQAYSVQGLLLLTLKAHQKSQHYSQTQINTYPLGIHGIAIISEFFVAVLIDRYGLRLTTGLTLCAIQCVVSVVLLIPNIPVGGNLSAFYLAATAYGINPLLYGWPNQIAAKTGDDAVRSMVLAGMVATGMLLYTFWGIAIYPADQAPYWRKGYIAMICVSVVLAGWLFVVRWLDQRTPEHSADKTEMDGENITQVAVVDAQETIYVKS